jgi:ribonuclease R
MSRHQSKFIPQPKKSNRGKDSDAPQVRRPGPKPEQASAQAEAQTPAQAHYRPNETFEAIFLGHPEGTGGFLRPKGFQKGAGLDLLVDWRDAHNAIHGDKVMAEVAGQSHDGRLRGRVLKVVARGENPIPAHLQKQAWGLRAVPLEPRLQQIVSVAPTDLAEDGDLVSIKLDPNPELPQLKGVVLARLGRLTDLKIENKLTAALYNLRTTFPDAVMNELAPFPTQIPEEWLQGREPGAGAEVHPTEGSAQGARPKEWPREDLRSLLTVTVDPPTAKDFDDAISLEVLPKEEGGGWLLGVHIADVSHYVAEGGPLDTEAHLRGTSVYFPDECIPMLPERLSGELCSLREGVDRLTLTAWMTLAEDLEVLETRFTESVIRSRRRLTYDQVKMACLDLDKRSRSEIGEEVCETLDQCLVLSRRLTAARLERGAMNLDTKETEFIFDEQGQPVDARPYPRHDAHKMIEEFMLLANEAVARFFTRKKIPTIYRIHDEPDPLKLEIFKNIASAFGLMRPMDQTTPEVLNALLDKIRGGPLEAMLNTMLLRSLKRAAYSADNIGHSGLALQDYLHFTSPIRRYPDLVVHRLLRKVLRNETLPGGLHGTLVIVAKQCSDTEQTATEAERENDRWKTCLIMKAKIGRRFDGRIQGFSPKVAFVRLESPFVEVGVPLGALGGNFEVDLNRTKASGMGVVLSIGDKVKVEITGVDEDLRRVSAWVVEAQAQDSKGKVLQFIPSLAAPATLREADFVQERPGVRLGGPGAGGPRTGGPRTGGPRTGREGKPPTGRAPRAVREAERPGRRSGERPGRPGDRPVKSRLPKGSVRGGGKKK